MIKKCPRCGGNGFFMNGMMRGSAEVVYDETGNQYETNLDKCYWEYMSKVIRCSNCGKIREDVYLDERTIREKN